MDSTCIFPYGIALTDWIQAFAALIAIPGAIAGFIVLFIRDKSKQLQIDSLAILAEQQKEEVKLLTKQISINLELFEFEKRKRKHAIMPIIQNAGGGGGGGGKWEIRLINNGETAYNFNLIIHDKHENVTVDSYPRRELRKGETFSINLEKIKDKNVRPRPEDYDANFDLSYEDIDDNHYKQTILNTGSGFQLLRPREEDIGEYTVR